MATLLKGLSSMCNAVCNTTAVLGTGFQQVRHHMYVNRWVYRDMKRRRLVEQYGEERLHLLAMKRNRILPATFKEMVSKEFVEKIPRQTALRQLTNRCIVTGKPRGVVYRYRLSRMVFRHLADYNQLAGVQRALW